MKLVGAVVCCCMFAASCAFQDTARADVTVLREFHETREKREADDVTNMPDFLALRVTSSGDDAPAVFRLRRQALLQPRLSSAASSSLRVMDSAVYSDPSRGASFIVRRQAEGTYTLDGTFVHKNEDFQISPMIRSRRASPLRRKLTLNRKQTRHRIISVYGSGGPNVSFAGDSVVNKHTAHSWRDQDSNDSRQQRGGRGQQEGGRGQRRGGGRGKRQTQTVTHFLETAFIVDFSDYSKWLGEYGSDAISELTLYYTYLAQSIAQRFANARTGNPALDIVFSVSHLEVLQTRAEASYMEDLNSGNGEADGGQALDTFFTFLQGRQDIPVADHYVTFTGLDLIAANDGQKIDLAGIAFKGTVCTASALSVTENSGSAMTAAVAAHEIGHSLSADHDSDAGCQDSDSYVMTTTLSVPSSVNLWSFSDCSLASFDDFLSGVTCTAAVTSDPPALPSSGSRAGQVLSRDEQCALHFTDNTSVFCEGTQTLDSLCFGMLCTIPTNPNTCRYILPQEYTSCGNGQWCEQGACVSIPASTPVPTIPATTPAPTDAPTRAPVTNAPTDAPTRAPVTNAPTDAPTRAPVTNAPTDAPTRAPVTNAPTDAPTDAPTRAPVTNAPTDAPTDAPTRAPVTNAPTDAPTRAPVTNAPTDAPTRAPVTNAPTDAPTRAPVTNAPTDAPTRAPVTNSPTNAPTRAPVTNAPTDAPTRAPVTDAPTRAPVTNAPTDAPTRAPVTNAPTRATPTTATPTTATPTRAPRPSPTTAAPARRRTVCRGWFWGRRCQIVIETSEEQERREQEQAEQKRREQEKKEKAKKEQEKREQELREQLQREKDEREQQRREEQERREQAMREQEAKREQEKQEQQRREQERREQKKQEEEEKNEQEEDNTATTAKPLTPYQQWLRKVWYWSQRG